MFIKLLRPLCWPFVSSVCVYKICYRCYIILKYYVVRKISNTLNTMFEKCLKFFPSMRQQSNFLYRILGTHIVSTTYLETITCNDFFTTGIKLVL